MNGRLRLSQKFENEYSQFKKAHCTFDFVWVINMGKAERLGGGENSTNIQICTFQSFQKFKEKGRRLRNNTMTKHFASFSFFHSN